MVNLTNFGIVSIISMVNLTNFGIISIVSMVNLTNFATVNKFLNLWQVEKLLVLALPTSYLVERGLAKSFNC